jgi:hypothetical protein
MLSSTLAQASSGTAYDVLCSIGLVLWVGFILYALVDSNRVPPLIRSREYRPPWKGRQGTKNPCPQGH